MEKFSNTSEKGRHSTVEFILRRMNRSKGFPAVSENISLINRKLSSKDRNFSASEIASLVLKDYALTTRLLKQVNSSFYSKARKPVTTVSRAVVLLGFEQVRILATSLMLFEHFRGYDGTDELKEAALISLMSSVLARKFAEKMAVDAEEAAICAMLHNLGQNLVILHLQKEHDAIKREMKRKGLGEQAASRAVLDKSYYELGMEIAREWKFSDKIIKSMVPLEDKDVKKPTSETEILKGISHYSNEICDIIRAVPKDEQERAFELLSKRFEKFAPISNKDLLGIVHDTIPEVKKLAGTLNISGSPMIRKMMLTAEIPDEPTAGKEPSPSAQKDHVDSKALTPEGLPETSTDNSDSFETRESEDIIINGIQEITNTLAEDYTINDLIAMVVEILYRGFTFDRVIFCMKSPKKQWITARFGLGKDIKKMLGTFAFRISTASDVFNVAVTQNRDFRIKDADAAEMRPRIPDWYRRTVNAPSFIIYPIFIDNICLAFLYADREDAVDPIPEKYLNYMKTLRNQLVIGIKQKRLLR